MPSKQEIEAVSDYIRETAGGHKVENTVGDFLWMTRNPINITKALEAAEKVSNSPPPIIDASELLPQEKPITEALEALQREYKHKSKPLIEHLIKLRSMRMPRYMVNPNVIIEPLPTPPEGE